MRRAVYACILLSFLGAWVALRPMPQDADASLTRTPLLRSRGVVDSPTTAPTVEFAKLQGSDGFWRLAQTTDGVWWYLSPTGTPEFLNTVTTVQPYQHARVAEGARFVSRDWNGDANDANGDLDAWAVHTIDRVRNIGFKGLGAWCNPVFHKHDVPITRDLNIWSWMKPEFKRFYSPGWAETAE